MQLPKAALGIFSLDDRGWRFAHGCVLGWVQWKYEAAIAWSLAKCQKESALSDWRTLSRRFIGIDNIIG
jgi:hypothetical protein